jgi:cytochrome P450 / NADPH-cytochrome P450 reductase
MKPRLGCSLLYGIFLKNPEKLHASQAEVGSILGDSQVEAHLLPQAQIHRCSLTRHSSLYPPPIGQALREKKDTLLGGKYPISTTVTLLANTYSLHRSKDLWGLDADSFTLKQILNGELQSMP